MQPPPSFGGSIEEFNATSNMLYRMVTEPNNMQGLRSLEHSMTDSMFRQEMYKVSGCSKHYSHTILY